MSINKKHIIESLKDVCDANGHRLFENKDSIKNIHIDDSVVSLDLFIDNPSLQFKNKLKNLIKEEIYKKYPSILININFSRSEMKSSSHSATSEIKNIIAISSGKGGVGKSTISSNLAVSLQKQGYSVGLIDADIYGPSIPMMFDAENEKPKLADKSNDSLMVPVISYGVKIMSIGFFSDPSNAIVWRGPMATKALKQIIEQTAWGALDYLLIDLPPGTSDIHLSLVQTISLTGALVVTTPQPVSLIDARKAIKMFTMKQINVPIIGLVENMSYYLVNDEKYYPFGRDGGKSLSESEDIPLLLELPLNQSIREAGDIGRPAALQNSPLADKIDAFSKKVVDRIHTRNESLPSTKKVDITHNRGCN